jgi:hypothetical protein
MEATFIEHWRGSLRVVGEFQPGNGFVDRAQIRYREKVIEELEARLTAARDGKPIDISIFARMPIPRSYAAEYEQAIEELRWHTGETIELSSRDFARFVLDKWEWAQQFAASNMVYLTE